MEVAVSRLDTLEEIDKLSRQVRFTNPLHEMWLLYDFRSTSFPVPGLYQVALTVDREVLAQRVLEVI